MVVTHTADSRLDSLTHWIREDLQLSGAQIVPASADASFRRYFRVVHGSHSYIAMDAPPAKEDLAPFLNVAALLLEVGVNVPRVLEQNLKSGFLLLSDLGSRQYLGDLAQHLQVDALYGDALDALLQIQARGAVSAGLPAYDAPLLLREMQLMPDWFFDRHLGLAGIAAPSEMLQSVFAVLIENALVQPQTFVHRDYHSRNLMICSPGKPGILDFQDAVRGPITYDLVSLLKDCYIAWPVQRVRSWALEFRERRQRHALPAARTEAEFLRWFDLMGMQRHIKVLGIFARLWYRDAKRGYLKDLPLVLGYVAEVAQRYPEFAEFAYFLQSRVEPAFTQAQSREGQ